MVCRRPANSPGNFADLEFPLVITHIQSRNFQLSAEETTSLPALEAMGIQEGIYKQYS